jgi:sphingomyelin phosphodiesterase 2
VPNSNIPKTHAGYEKPPKQDSYHTHRLSQVWELSKLVRAATERSFTANSLVLLVGDLNVVPGSLEYRLLSAHSGPLRDAWTTLHPDASLGAATHPEERARRRPIPTAEFNVRQNGVTSDSVYNTWRWTKKQQRLLGPGKEPCVVPSDAIDRRGKRLDYIFVGSGPGDDVSLSESGVRGRGRGGGSSAGWVVKDVKVGMISRHPVLGCSLSDHFSVEATLKFHTPTPRPLHHQSSDVALTNGTYLQSPTGSDHRLADGYDAQLQGLDTGERCLPSSTYDEILGMVQRYRLRELGQRRWMAGYFYASLLVTLGCLVAVWFSPREFVAFLLMLLSTTSLASGVVFGLIALLFFGSELRALKEFEWEIRNAKEAASGGVVIHQDERRKDWH